jgi:hypothetical protein
MNYYVDKNLAWDGIFTYSTDSGTKYLIKISETAPESGVWKLDFIRLEGNPTSIEIFKTMKTLLDISMEYVNEKNINNAILMIAGNSEEEIQKKTKAFTRWLKEDWTFEVINRPEVYIPGVKGKKIVQTNVIFIKRKPKIDKKVEISNNHEGFKYCPNCGTENKGWQFCPNCGTNLKQA